LAGLADGGLPVLGNAANAGESPADVIGGNTAPTDVMGGNLAPADVIGGTSGQAMTGALTGMPAAIPGVGAITNEALAPAASVASAASAHGAHSGLGSLTGKLGTVTNAVPDLGSDTSDTLHGLSAVTGMLPGLGK
jgi:hypothetical protein